MYTILVFYFLGLMFDMLLLLNVTFIYRALVFINLIYVFIIFIRSMVFIFNI